MMLFWLGPVAWLACVAGLIVLVFVASAIAVKCGWEPKKP